MIDRVVTAEMTDFRKVGRGAQVLDEREERLVNGLQVSSRERDEKVQLMFMMRVSSGSIELSGQRQS